MHCIAWTTVSNGDTKRVISEARGVAKPCKPAVSPPYCVAQSIKYFWESEAPAELATKRLGRSLALPSNEWAE